MLKEDFNLKFFSHFQCQKSPYPTVKSTLHHCSKHIVKKVTYSNHNYVWESPNHSEYQRNWLKFRPYHCKVKTIVAEPVPGQTFECCSHWCCQVFEKVPASFRQSLFWQRIESYAAQGAALESTDMYDKLRTNSSTKKVLSYLLTLNNNLTLNCNLQTTTSAFNWFQLKCF